MAVSIGWKNIRLSAKVFGHISQGIYRTSAGAIKELVSNAFDADATIVRIHTGFPHFETFSCEDNGSGMSLDEFGRLMERGIGTSYKRTVADARTPLHGRPVIGRLGIGILSLAQICTQFEIFSHHNDTKKAFHATILFPPYSKAEVDKILSKRAAVEDPDDAIPGGQYKLEEIKFDSTKVGVRVFTKFLREAFRKRMRNLSNFGNISVFRNRGPYENFERFMAATYGIKEKTQSLNLRSDYDQLLFGIAMASPLPYFQGGMDNIALAVPLLQNYQRVLVNYKFRVEVDNLTLARPLYLPSDRGRHAAKDCRLGKPTPEKFQLKDGSHQETVGLRRYPVTVKGSDETFNIYEFSYSQDKVGGRPLIFSGYLFQQTGRLYPREIQGVLVRVRNVAIGNYDGAMMAYPYAEGPRYTMISLELFIRDGFEDALNIDRDSFNELDPHYIRTQSFVHSLLHEVIFHETWTEEKERNKRRRQEKSAEREGQFIKTFSTVGRQRYARIKVVESNRDLSNPSVVSPVRFNPTTKTIEIDSSHPLVRKTLRRRKFAQLAELILVSFERANRESEQAKRREIFYTLLSEIFGEV